MDLTILIPTINRHEYLGRALEYYRTMKFDGCIFIGDSSTGQQLQKNKDLVSNEKSLNIIYRVYPNPPHLHDGMVVQKMSEEVSTKYVAQTGDDDFVVVPNIQKCIDFLENNPDFIGAHGSRVALKLRDDEPYGDIIEYGKWPEQNWIEDNALDRWIYYNRNALSSQAWVVYRDNWKKVYAKSDQIPCRYLGPEYLPCSIQAILGKAKELDFLTLVCQVGYLHQIFNFEKHPIFDLICSDLWSPSIKVVKETIINTICDLDPKADINYVKNVVLGELWHHMIFFMAEQYNKMYGPEEEKKESLRFRNNNDIAIPDPNWEDYKDFKPIHDLLIKDKPYKDEVHKQLTILTEGVKQ